MSTTTGRWPSTRKVVIDPSRARTNPAPARPPAIDPEGLIADGDKDGSHACACAAGWASTRKVTMKASIRAKHRMGERGDASREGIMRHLDPVGSSNTRPLFDRTPC